MNEGLREFIRDQRKFYVKMAALSYLTQGVAALAGAMCLWAAIDDFLRERFFLSAFFTAAAFWNSKLFNDSAGDRRAFIKALRGLRELERKLSS
jgi:hypothetical protein